MKLGWNTRRAGIAGIILGSAAIATWIYLLLKKP